MSTDLQKFIADGGDVTTLVTNVQADMTAANAITDAPGAQQSYNLFKEGGLGRDALHGIVRCDNGGPNR